MRERARRRRPILRGGIAAWVNRSPGMREAPAAPSSGASSRRPGIRCRTKADQGASAAIPPPAATPQTRLTPQKAKISEIGSVIERR